MRLRGDWSDTGPRARPESERERDGKVFAAGGGGGCLCLCVLFWLGFSWAFLFHFGLGFIFLFFLSIPEIPKCFRLNCPCFKTRPSLKMVFLEFKTEVLFYSDF